MPDIDEIVGQFAPLIATAAKAYGARLLDRTQAAAGDATVALAQRALHKILKRAKAPAPLERTVREMAERPGTDTAMLASQLHELLSRDSKLARELARMLPTSASAAGARAVAIAGSTGRDAVTISGDHSSAVVVNVGGSANGIPVAHQLASAPFPFVDRDEELKQLQHLLRRSMGELSSSSTLVLVSGMAGVGKTGLALQWAHAVKGDFPDGQLFVDLRGYAEEQSGVPASAGAVLAGWLRDVWGVSPDVLPEGEDARAALFRSKLEGRRMLLVLDNAVSDKQIIPLLPGTGSCFVIVTSRDRLPGLLAGGGHCVQLERLPHDEAVHLLTKMIGERAVADPTAVDSMVRNCGHLTLALRVVAGRAKNADVRAPLAKMADELTEETERLARLRIRGSAKFDVRAALSWSYQGLPDEQAQSAFRLFGLHPAPGASTDAYAISRLADADVAAATDLLDLLRDRNLIDTDLTGNDRFGMHDLLRLYAQELVNAPERIAERRAALQRLAEAYYGCVNHAFDRLNNDNPMIDGDALAAWREGDPDGVRTVDGVGGALGWFERERENLIAVVRAAARMDPPLAVTPRLACSLFYFLEIGGHLAQWQEVEEIAEQVAFGYGDRHDQARSLRNRGRLAMVHVLTDHERLHDEADPRPSPGGACDRAITLLEHSRDLYRQEYEAHGLRRDRDGEATTLRELADACRLEIDPVAPDPELVEKAISAYRQADVVYEELGNENGKASLQLALGRTYALVGRVAEARLCFEHSLAYAGPARGRNVGRDRHPRLKGYALLRLGDLCYSEGEYGQAVDWYDAGIEVFETAVSTDLTARARALGARGRALGELGDLAGARASLTAAKEIFKMRPLGEDDPEAQTVAGWISRYGVDG